MVIHQNKVRWLFWLRWKILARNFTRSTGTIIATIVLLLFALLIGLVVGAGTFFAYRFLPTPANTEFLFIVLTGVYVLWVILPLLEFTTNEGLDISKLSLFPLTRGELMVSLLFSTLLDVPTIALLLVLCAVVVGWATSLPLALLALVAMIIFYVQLISISQLVLALLQKVLQSRRFRDISVLLIILLSSSGYLCQFAIRGLVTPGSFNALTHATISPYLQWFPPGMAARAIQQATVGHWGASILWLLVLTAISLLFLYLWQLTVERGLTAADSGGSAKTVRHRNTPGTAYPSGTAAQPSRNFLGLPPQISTLTIKDLKYIRRDPQIQAIFIQSLLSSLFIILYFGISFFNNTGSTSTFLSGPWLIFIAPLWLQLSLFTFSYNTLGLERQSLTTLFLFPVEPRYILWSKNIVVFIIGLVEIAVFVTLIAFLTHSWPFLLPAIVIGLCGVLTTTGIGNITSVFLPQKVRLARRGFQTQANSSANAGCLRTLLSLAAMAAMFILLIPVAAAVVVPLFLHLEWLWSITLILSIAYAFIIYLVTLFIAAPRMLAREPEIIAIVTKE